MFRDHGTALSQKPAAWLSDLEDIYAKAFARLDVLFSEERHKAAPVPSVGG